MRPSSASRRRPKKRRPHKTGPVKASKAEIIQFADLVRSRMDRDEIKELVRRTPGIEPEDQRIVYLRLATYDYNADIAAETNVKCSRTTVGRHLADSIPKVINRYNLDQQKAGA